MASRTHSLALIGACAALLAGCSASVSPPEKKERRVFSIAARQYAVDPVYGRVRKANAPDEIPDAHAAKTGPPIMPVFHLELKNDTLESAGRALAATARYRSYCASAIAGRKITLERLGTIDELAVELQKAADIRVVVDHDTKEVRLLAKSVEPKLLSDAKAEGAAGSKEGLKSKVADEHRSNHQRTSL